MRLLREAVTLCGLSASRLAHISRSLMREYDPPTSVRLPKVLRDYLLKHAKTERKSLSRVVIEILRAWVARNRGKALPPDLIRGSTNLEEKIDAFEERFEQEDHLGQHPRDEG